LGTSSYLVRPPNWEDLPIWAGYPKPSLGSHYPKCSLSLPSLALFSRVLLYYTRFIDAKVVSVTHFFNLYINKNTINNNTTIDTILKEIILYLTAK
jgi:hypothetical protein